MSLKSQFANPGSITEHHIGVLNMLAHFHYESKGRYPISLTEDPTTLDQFAAAAELPLRLAEFVKRSAERVKARGMTRWFPIACGDAFNEFLASYISNVRATGDFGNDFYFVSQLFDRAWQPTLIAG